MSLTRFIVIDLAVLIGYMAIVSLIGMWIEKNTTADEEGFYLMAIIIGVIANLFIGFKFLML